MTFIVGLRYWSDDRHEMMIVVNRFDKSNLIRVEVGSGHPANYKIRKDNQGWEYIKAKGHTFSAF